MIKKSRQSNQSTAQSEAGLKQSTRFLKNEQPVILRSVPGNAMSYSATISMRSILEKKK